MWLTVDWGRGGLEPTTMEIGKRRSYLSSIAESTDEMDQHSLVVDKFSKIIQNSFRRQMQEMD
jgi:hypothetical protein